MTKENTPETHESGTVPPLSESPGSAKYLGAALDFRADAQTAKKPRIRRAARRYMRTFALAWKEERATKPNVVMSHEVTVTERAQHAL
jgi:hypothetical protein